ncbi:hypothetical protein V6N13_147386 [Hibiscus sabdariffa]
MLTEGWKIEEENHRTVLTLTSEVYRKAASGGFEMLDRCTSLLVLCAGKDQASIGHIFAATATANKTQKLSSLTTQVSALPSS